MLWSNASSNLDLLSFQVIKISACKQASNTLDFLLSALMCGKFTFCRAQPCSYNYDFTKFQASNNSSPYEFIVRRSLYESLPTLCTNLLNRLFHISLQTRVRNLRTATIINFHSERLCRNLLSKSTIFSELVAEKKQKIEWRNIFSLQNNFFHELRRLFKQRMKKDWKLIRRQSAIRFKFFANLINQQGEIKRWTKGEGEWKLLLNFRNVWVVESSYNSTSRSDLRKAIRGKLLSSFN